MRIGPIYTAEDCDELVKLLKRSDNTKISNMGRELEFEENIKLAIFNEDDEEFHLGKIIYE